MANERTFEPIAVETAKHFAYGEWAVEGGASFKYRWFTPAREEGKYYPLVIFLHGIGERGIDNELHVAANIGAYGYALPENQAKYPCYVLAPQCPEEYKYVDPKFEMSFIPLLKEFIENNAIDRNRVYITGLSMGGTGTWMFAMARPNTFAAIMPVCGSGIYWNVANLLKTPIYMVHGDCDTCVPISDSVEMLTSINSRGGNAKLKICYGVGHDAWNYAYTDDSLLEWMLSQRLPE